jgi:hypothetical protein
MAHTSSNSELPQARRWRSGCREARRRCWRRSNGAAGSRETPTPRRDRAGQAVERQRSAGLLKIMSAASSAAACGPARATGPCTLRPPFASVTRINCPPPRLLRAAISACFVGTLERVASELKGSPRSCSGFMLKILCSKRWSAPIEVMAFIHGAGAVRLNHPRLDLVRSIGVCPASPPTP